MRLQNFVEGVRMAFDAIRSNKVRSFLTILGVVIGVATVMAMASIVQGIRGQIFSTLNAAVPNLLYVTRLDPGTFVNPDNLPPELRSRPVVSEEDAAAISRAGNVRHAARWLQVRARISFEQASTQQVQIFGADERFMDLQGGTLLRGRFFAPSEVRGGAFVAVLSTNVANTVFGQRNPIGQYVRIGGRAARVIGTWQPPDNVFQPPGTEVGAIIPYRAASGAYTFNETADVFIVVLGTLGTSVNDVKDAVSVALRRSRGLRPGQPDNFGLMTQDQVLDIINQLTGAFFLVMVALSGVALMVGGIGVMAIMMVSVTSRTREIGTRMALGATRREILWQFLVEAATLTGVGGALGIVTGLALGEILKKVRDIGGPPPLWSAVLAAMASIGIGLIFGLYPANRAAKMQPIDALRFE